MLYENRSTMNTADNIVSQAYSLAKERVNKITPYGNGQDGYKIYLSKLPDEARKKRRFLFIGTGRCGTKYISALLQ